MNYKYQFVDEMQKSSYNNTCGYDERPWSYIPQVIVTNQECEATINHIHYILKEKSNYDLYFSR